MNLQQLALPSNHIIKQLDELEYPGKDTTSKILLKQFMKQTNRRLSKEFEIQNLSVYTSNDIKRIQDKIEPMARNSASVIPAIQELTQLIRKRTVILDPIDAKRMSQSGQRA